MNEIRFLHSNKSRWEEFEQLINVDYQVNPDKLSDLYVCLTDDLAYARTYFPGSRTEQYLNHLTSRVHQMIFRSQPVNRNGIVRFWINDYPLIVYSCRKEIFISIAVFVVAVLIGYVSNKYDQEFVRIILGDSYVNMTLANIDKGDPMAVYKSMNQVNMFLGISMNNIYVSFLAFVFGIFTAFGSGFILLQNGIMLGTFQGFLIQKGLFLESVSTIWIHGTIEIFAITVAGAAGIAMGNSFVFPGTYTRLHSFRMGTLKGIKLVTGLIPFFIAAAFLEGFVTRYTSAPYLLKFSIIGVSLIIIIYYFFIYPKKLNSKSLSYGTNPG